MNTGIGVARSGVGVGPAASGESNVGVGVNTGIGVARSGVGALVAWAGWGEGVGSRLAVGSGDDPSLQAARSITVTKTMRRRPFMRGESPGPIEPWKLGWRG